MDDGATRTTTDHDEIRRWAEERDAQPVTVDGSGIELAFPGHGDDELTAIAWEDWFATFEERGLALRYQERTADGQPSNFNQLVTRS